MRSDLLRAAASALFLLAVIVGGCNLTNAPSASAQAAFASNVVVLCSSCAYEGMPREGHLILMDSKTGDIWAYSDNAMATKAPPIYVGTLGTVGQPVVKKR